MAGRVVFIDTSAWIEYLKKTSHAITKEVESALAINTASTCWVVLAELLQGARSEKEIELIKDLPSVVKILKETESTWKDAGILSNKLRKQGKNIHLIDCYLVVLAKQNNARILSLDKHFPAITEWL
ncbi:PIN domain-containing protein [bacterium]|nr:MAG: PIN domain-containing protein [bacterium]